MDWTERLAREYRAKIEKAASLQSDEDALESVELFPAWREGIAVAVGERYQYDNVLYKVVQAHTTQADWAPDLTPALWAKVSVEDWPEWEQPAGTQDAYMIGDHVAHNGKHWESEVDYNVWEPGTYGWVEV